ncbi:5-oxoprolinase subunit C family protein [Aestuariimicrobium ganziense]|uniref:5-oxoprolinase subunit C family protein n=1 Tax=Aestuariimicrobium ganziense TaxID=2773677 RepID=UPI001941C0B3|nr:biotin-dependent carboxyltransferase family protein [Aestuariimicrobium ganziense]
MTLRVVEPGLQCLVQDLGRPGWAHLGVSEGGAMDRSALRRANRLVGNPEQAAGLELLLGGTRFIAEDDCLLAVTGAVAEVTVDGRAVDQHRAVMVAAGQEVTIGRAVAGLRCYLALRGGIEAEAVLGSCSTDPVTGLGPAPVRAGDELVAGDAGGAVPTADLAQVHLPSAEVTVRAMLGPRHDWVEPDDLALLGSLAWRVSPQCDRIGIRLTGGVLRRRVTDELPSELVVRGAVQLPPSGEPLVFGADHPTTGGYPVVAVVLDDDIDLLGQVGPGSVVRFDLLR